jgi:hypothetical protein
MSCGLPGTLPYACYAPVTEVSSIGTAAQITIQNSNVTTLALCMRNLQLKPQLWLTNYCSLPYRGTREGDVLVSVPE